MRIIDGMQEFLSEGQFRDWVLSGLQAQLDRRGNLYVVLHSKNVNDIIVCKNIADAPLALFIEVKYAKGTSGRIGMGDRKGQGFQPEILIRRPEFFERYTRWLVGSEAGLGVLADCDTLRRHAVGGVFAEGKQNNIRPSIFDPDNRPFLIEDSPGRVLAWLNSF